VNNNKMEADITKHIENFLNWMNENNYRARTIYIYKLSVERFNSFVSKQKIQKNNIYTLDTLNAFIKYSGRSSRSEAIAVRMLSSYLYEHQIIDSPIKRQNSKLPEIYEEYIEYYKNIQNPSKGRISSTRKTLHNLYDFLTNEKVNINNLNIVHIDAFLKTYIIKYSASSKKSYISSIRLFLKYLYFEKNILKKNLASMIVCPPFFEHSNPPKFLIKAEIKQLFASLKYEKPNDLRVNAMIYLAYTLGLRPQEISLILLDDIFFQESELVISCRKNTKSTRLPLPEETLKAIAAYIISARPKSQHRSLFLTLLPPYRPVNGHLVAQTITSCMHKANINKSAYCLRHSFAQNLLEAGISIFEIKEMLGHDHIQTTSRYIHIHTKLMKRDLLIDETI